MSRPAKLRGYLSAALIGIGGFLCGHGAATAGAWPPPPAFRILPASETSVTVSWQNWAGPFGPRATGVLSYQLFSGPAGGPQSLVDLPATQTAYTVRHLRRGSRYQAMLRAVVTPSHGTTDWTPVLAQRVGPALITPGPGERVGQPRFWWTALRDVRYYNLQVWQAGVRVLSVWPDEAHLLLARRLRPGTYAWRVWPGKGAKSAHRYGRQIGRTRKFTVAG